MKSQKWHSRNERERERQNQKVGVIVSMKLDNWWTGTRRPTDIMSLKVPLDEVTG